MACPYCDIAIGETCINNGKTYCLYCQEEHDLTGSKVKHIGVHQDQHHFEHDTRVCACGRRLNRISVPCHNSESMVELQKLFGLDALVSA